MAKIYYGDGDATLEATDAVYCSIRVKYPIEITDKTPSGYALMASSNTNKIVMSRIKNVQSVLTDLFTYEGELIILNATVINRNGDGERCSLKKVMDYTELLDSNPEDLTVNPEDLKTKSIKNRRITRMKMNDPIVENLDAVAGQFYFENGKEYTGGKFHVHIETGKRMSGGTHTEDSQDLYFKEENEAGVSSKLTLATHSNYMNTKYMKIRSTPTHKNVRRSNKIGRNT